MANLDGIKYEESMMCSCVRIMVFRGHFQQYFSYIVTICVVGFVILYIEGNYIYIKSTHCKNNSLYSITY